MKTFMWSILMLLVLLPGAAMAGPWNGGGVSVGVGGTGGTSVNVNGRTYWAGYRRGPAVRVYVAPPVVQYRTYNYPPRWYGNGYYYYGGRYRGRW